MKRTFFSFSFGCRVNQAEKEEIDKLLLDSGWRYSKENPSLYLINSCAVTVKAEREVRQHIYQVNKKFPKAKIILTGCAATYWLKKDKQPELPLHLIVDNKNKDNLIKLLQIVPSQPSAVNLRGCMATAPRRQKLSDFNKFSNSGRVLVKIQDGCHKFCSYCIVPYLRGLPKSCPIKEVVSKINSLDKEIKEVILTAVNTEAYGFDTKENFNRLLKEIIEKTYVSRISLGSIHPLSINTEFLKFYNQYLPQERLVNFFHVPLQSGSDRILSLMKRGYKSDEFMEKVNKLHQINPLGLIATDIIVGFLDETDKDFEDTYEFLKKSPISKFHLFRFSVRNNTVACHLAKKLPQPNLKIRSERANAVIKLGRRKYQKFLIKQIGRVSKALFLEKRVGEYQLGLLDNQALIYAKSDKNIAGTIKKVKIIEFKNGRLFAKIA